MGTRQPQNMVHYLGFVCIFLYLGFGFSNFVCMLLEKFHLGNLKNAQYISTVPLKQHVIVMSLKQHVIVMSQNPKCIFEHDHMC